MGIFDIFRSKSPADTMQEEMKRLSPILFPGGHEEIQRTGKSISGMLDNRIPAASAARIFASTKYLALTAKDKSKQRVVEYIVRQGMDRISEADAGAIYDRFIVSRNSQQNATLDSVPSLQTSTENPKIATSRQTTTKLGSKECPIIIDPPEQLEKLRRQYSEILRESQYAHLAKANEVIDPMIAEAIKMARLEVLLGKEGKDWQCGERNYLAGAIQSQQMIFKDGRPPIFMYFDFSRFGGSLDWDSKS